MNKWNIKEQRAAVNYLVYELTRKSLKHSKTGRPFVEKPIDISISHKNDIVGAAVVPNPYKVGIDIEYLKTHLNTRYFFGPVITNNETGFFKKFCKSNNFSYSSGIAIFWSIKESFFKCIDYGLKPAKISISEISKKGTVRFLFSDEIEVLLAKKNLKIHSINVDFKGNYVFSWTIAETASLLAN